MSGVNRGSGGGGGGGGGGGVKEFARELGEMIFAKALTKGTSPLHLEFAFYRAVRRGRPLTPP